MYKKIITADNTETFLNEEIGESYHSQTGAVEEALKKYAIPCKIAEKALSEELCILDVCFGMGYNSAMAIDVALAANPSCKITVVGLEYDKEIVTNIQDVNPPIKFFEKYKQLKVDNLSFASGKVSVTLVLGDARETVKSLGDEMFDAIFFDPFSPKTAPDMWKVSFFKEMYRVLKKDGILATYSCARMVRENMAAAGLFYDEGPIVGRRGPGTIAKKWV